MIDELTEAFFDFLYCAMFVVTAWLASILIYVERWSKLYCVVPFVLWTLSRYDRKRRPR